jgi:hypothetical protein
MPDTYALRDHLIRAASDVAKSALDAVTTGDRRVAGAAFIEAGMAVEFLMKAVVADVSPTLLFVQRNPGEKRAHEAMLRAHRDDTVDTAWLSEQKSAEMTFVRGFAYEVLPTLKAVSALVAAVTNQRNSVAHMYAVDGAKLRETVTAFARVADVVLTHLDVNSERFWGAERLRLVTTLIDERIAEVSAAVQLKLREAELHVQRLVAPLTRQEANGLLRRLEKGGMPFVPVETTVLNTECPSCAYNAELWLRVSDFVENPDELELTDWDGNGAPDAALIPQAVYGVRLECPVCFLSLNQSELAVEYPELADLNSYVVEPRKASLQEYEEITWNWTQPDVPTYPHGRFVG